MTLEYWVLILIWSASIVAVALYIPNHKRREAVLAFLACQAVTWLNSLIHVNYGLLAFPVREFPKATDLLFTSEYMMYPLMCAFYYIYEPYSGNLLRLFYLVGCISCLTIVDTVIVTYTDLIDYPNYSWYWTWIDFFAIFLLINIYCKWFFKQGICYQDRRVAR
jgi:hypothetical protein